MEAAIEQKVCTNSRCYACGSLVYAVEKKKTANHVSCFLFFFHFENLFLGLSFQLFSLSNL